MRSTSKTEELSERYTYHCVRATAANQLRDKGFHNEQICKVTGYKNLRSLESYFRKRCPDSEMFAMNISLQNDVGLPSTSSATEYWNSTAVENNFQQRCDVPLDSDLMMQVSHETFHIKGIVSL